jgi:hypothetical protein
MTSAGRTPQHGQKPGRAYVVRDAGPDAGPGGVTQVYAYTLHGLTSALEDARDRSIAGTPQVLAVMAEGKSTVIRRFEDGHEAPLAPLEGDREPRAAYAAPDTIPRAVAASSVMMAAIRGSVANLAISAASLTVHSRQGKPAAAARATTPYRASL